MDNRPGIFEMIFTWIAVIGGGWCIVWAMAYTFLGWFGG